MTLIQRVELLAEDVKKLEGEGGGGDLSAYLTKDEASSTYETQSAASSALALKADVATTYTKSEVDSAIADVSAPEPVVIPLSGTTGVFPEDKYYVLEQHLPFKLSESSPNILYFDKFYSSGNYYYYSNRDALTYVMSIKIWTNNNTYRYEISQKQGGGEISYITGANLLRSFLSSSTHAVLNTQSTSPDYYSLPDNISLNNSSYSNGIYYRQNSFTSITNCPVSEPFYMIDETLNGDSNTHNQILIPQKNPTCFYKRVRYPENGQWIYGDWQKFSADVGTATSTATLPSAGTGTTFDTGIEWTYIQTMNDFILDSEGLQIKFRYGFKKGSYVHYFGYILDRNSTIRIAHLELGAPTGSGTTALATWISSGAIPTT